MRLHEGEKGGRRQAVIGYVFVQERGMKAISVRMIKAQEAA
jgi:hypothetical protein